jgi:DNA-binding winged helix-turn-helix (wHTH) protein/tetratricopeptide (TPR) repeat protein
MTGDLRIGIWLVQPSLNTISQNGTTRQLEPKVMEVLVCLAHHAGETLPKEQLLKTIWPDTFVSDDVLIRSISEIRRAFDDDPRESKFIQTIPKRGYRLVPSVEVVKRGADHAGDSSNTPEIAQGAIVWTRAFRIGAGLGAIAVVLLLVFLAAGPTGWRIQVKMTPAEQARLRNVRPVNPKALDAYAAARFLIDRAGKFQFDKGREAQKDELQKAFSYLDSAIEQDPSYRPTYLAYFEAIENADPPSPFQYLPKAKAGLLKALELAEEDMDGHLALAKLLMRYEYDWTAAEREYKRAIEVNPSSGYAHFSYSEYLANVGRTIEADKELTNAQSLSPAHDYYDDHFAVLQRTDRTLEQQRHALEEKTSNNAFVLMIMAKNYAIAGRFKESVEMWERSLTVYGRPDFAHVLRQAEGTGGPRFALEEWMRALEGYSSHYDDLPVGMAAFTYSSLGNKDRAFVWLDKAVEERNWCVPFLRRDNVWNPLRSDPRFKSLLRRVGLPP